MLHKHQRINARNTQPALDLVTNPHKQIERTKEILHEAVNCANQEIAFVTNRKARTLLETTIALIQGLLKAYDYYEQNWAQKVERRVITRENN